MNGDRCSLKDSRDQVGKYMSLIYLSTATAQFLVDLWNKKPLMKALAAHHTWPRPGRALKIPRRHAALLLRGTVPDNFALTRRWPCDNSITSGPIPFCSLQNSLLCPWRAGGNLDCSTRSLPTTLGSEYIILFLEIERYTGVIKDSCRRPALKTFRLVFQLSKTKMISQVRATYETYLKLRFQAHYLLHPRVGVPP